MRSIGIGAFFSSSRSVKPPAVWTPSDTGLTSIRTARGRAVVPHGGRDGRGTTNPIAMGIPVPGAPPVILDFATSATAEGTVRVARNKGVPIPPECLLDAEGRPTTDPAALYADPPGNLVPFGGAVSGHKGGALWLMVDLLAGAVTGRVDGAGWGVSSHPGGPTEVLDDQELTLTFVAMRGAP